MDAIGACNESIARAMAVMAPWAAGRVIDEPAAVFVVGKGRFPSPYTNAVFPKRDVDAEAFLSRADAVFSDRRYVVWALGVGSDVARLATARSYTSFKDLPGMVIEAKVSPPSPSVSASLVTSKGDYADFVRVQAESFAELGPAAEGDGHAAR